MCYSSALGLAALRAPRMCLRAQKQPAEGFLDEHHTRASQFVKARGLGRTRLRGILNQNDWKQKKRAPPASVGFFFFFGGVFLEHICLSTCSWWMHNRLLQPQQVAGTITESEISATESWVAAEGAWRTARPWVPKQMAFARMQRDSIFLSAACPWTICSLIEVKHSQAAIIHGRSMGYVGRGYKIAPSIRLLASLQINSAHCRKIWSKQENVELIFWFISLFYCQFWSPPVHCWLFQYANSISKEKRTIISVYY